MRLAFPILALLTIPAAALADVKPAPLFSDHLVLEAGMSVPVWGTASPGEQVAVTFNGQQQRTTTGADAKWMVRLTGLQPGGPFEMTIAGTNTVAVKDVLVGEVWLGSGQSNMAFTVSKAKARYAGLVNEEEIIAAANFPKLRVFTGKEVKAYDPQPVVEGRWEVCSPETVPGFSAVAYLFGRNLHTELNVPVGMIVLAYGASTAEAWIPREALAADPLLKPMLDRFDASVNFYRSNPQAPADQAPQPPQTINARPGPPPRQQHDPVQDQHQPTVLFNGMIRGAISFAIRGVIWYQGESIVGGDAGVTLYPHVQNTLVTEWRKLWGEGDFPFYAVQLPALKNISNNPRVREGQAAVLSLPNTGVAVTLDIGDPNDVHPHNKEPLADRLVRIALANAYHRKIEYSGPTYESMTIEGSTIRLKFSNLGGGLIAKDGPLKWFQVAGADRKFVDAEARIDGETIVVSRGDVTVPQAVRYAWDNYPEGANLYNAAGLPAAPFRTDHW
ncbi:MAG: sialate O-acetylesterase [Bryobacteraceae bacterium]